MTMRLFVMMVVMMMIFIVIMIVFMIVIMIVIMVATGPMLVLLEIMKGKLQHGFGENDGRASLFV